MDDLSKFLDINKSDWPEDIKYEDSSSFCVEKCISERKSRRFEEG